jgi:hypothetical protein
MPPPLDPLDFYAASRPRMLSPAELLGTSVGERLQQGKDLLRRDSRTAPSEGKDPSPRFTRWS